MASLENKRAIGVFPNYHSTEQALRKLQGIGYAMDRVSVIGQDSEDLNRSGQGSDVQLQDIQTIQDDDTHADDGATTGGVAGGAVGGLTGLLVGLGTLAIPGVGPIMLAGVVATAIATTVAGGVIGVATGSLLGGLIGLGIPEDRAKIYNDKVIHGHYLVIVDGTASDIALAEPILRDQGVREWEVYRLYNQAATVGMNPENPNAPPPHRTETSGTKGRSSGRF